ncbi:DUF2252 domain-containing protein [Sediminicoccus sp. KRV36]|uniref:DUF2252 domain-containing protein n=1 Tax=Sediminicoccus sp. KRV36 TaxID=3133721 RepID=UPI00200FDF94|nr:DUF2252 domain-containing protein [Sediminicoccus rosea]UPY38310.1 DUF2252 domain-containing protein [Sediminicoccus rosea]
MTQVGNTAKRKNGHRRDVAPTPAAASLPQQTASLRERRAAGAALAKHLPLREHAAWHPARRKHDPIDLLIESSKGRIEQLLPIRYGRMLANPFAFYRGSAAVMAADLAHTPISGVQLQACGDCHALNFGGFATPERRIVFDINDFDETSIAPWEWDVKRLVASFALLGRYRNFSRDDTRECAWRAARAYRKRMAAYAAMPLLEAWYDNFDLDDLLDAVGQGEAQKKNKKKMQQAAKATSHALEFEKLAIRSRPEPRIRDQPPLIYHIDDERGRHFRDDVAESFRRYKETVQPAVATLLERYRLVDVAMKVVGVGSVGTLCAIVLLMSGSGDPLFLQVKEARRSVLEPYAGTSPVAHPGERVVRGQRLMQGASDMFLGWLVGAGKGHPNLYVRQLSDVKIKPKVEVAIPSGSKVYARYTGMTLARAHCRSGDPVLLSAYLGDGEAFEDAMADFAVTYADQAERDHEAMIAAVRAGRIETRSEA